MLKTKYIELIAKNYKNLYSKTSTLVLNTLDNKNTARFLTALSIFAGVQTVFSQTQIFPATDSPLSNTLSDSLAEQLKNTEFKIENKNVEIENLKNANEDLKKMNKDLVSQNTAILLLGIANAIISNKELLSKIFEWFFK